MRSQRVVFGAVTPSATTSVKQLGMFAAESTMGLATPPASVMWNGSGAEGIAPSGPSAGMSLISESGSAPGEIELAGSGAPGNEKPLTTISPNGLNGVIGRALSARPCDIVVREATSWLIAGCGMGAPTPLRNTFKPGLFTALLLTIS